MLIINADDFGRTHTINDAIIYCFTNNIINQTTVMVTESSFDEAIQLAKQHNIINKIGLHLNLDEGYPLTKDIKNINLFCDKNGLFNGAFRNNIKTRIYFSDPLVRKYCCAEIEAQVKKYVSIGSSLMHVDSHHHVHTNLSILKLLLPIAKDYGFKSMRICSNLNDKNISKMIYKSFINHIIRKYFVTTQYFGSYRTYLQCGLNDNVEIMVHPDIVKNKYVNVINRKKLVYMDLNQICLL
ncbi:MAG: ChbG/HpnK family deacetylase [Bacteroidales bacterium]|jgi:predicted glycoside hydrolase/deacetylase ChbG (UPF0249 family)|nr:ChbG/HpnK family deacetylase [Bacteroidales bacterium]